MVEIHGWKAHQLALSLDRVWDCAVWESEQKSKDFQLTHYWLKDVQTILESATPVKILDSTIYL